MDIDVPLFLYLPKDKSRTITKLYDFFLSLDCQEVNNRFFFGMPVDTWLSFCLSKHKNRTIRMQSHFLFGCLNKYHNTKVGQSEYNTIYFHKFMVKVIIEIKIAKLF